MQHLETGAVNANQSMRERVAKPGLKGWTHGQRGHYLPLGLPDRTPVQVLERSGWRDLIVEAHGGVWQVLASAIDCGREFRTKSGEWIPESDERARRFLLKLRDAFHRQDREKVYIHDTFNQQRSIAEIEWILERNGWEVPPL